MSDIFRVVFDASIRIVVVAGSVAVILLLARVRSGAVRHAAWTAVLSAMLLMPLLLRVTPEIGLRFGTQPAVSDAAIVPPKAVEIPATLAIEAAPAMPVAALASVEPGSRQSAIWPGLVVALYFCGLLLLLFRMTVGWRSARRILRGAEPVPHPLYALYQSDAISTPVVIGVLRPRIVLPRGWTSWSDAKLRAVLAHEQAHVRRRDPLVTMAAAWNRCLFWFHPLSWWLERKLASTAEEACDETAIRALGRSTEYAATLLEMAGSVRLHGGRLLTPGIGMYGAATLEKRIDRILSGDAGRAIPRSRKILVTAACAAAIFLGTACRRAAPQDATSTPAARWLQSQESYRLAVFYSGVLMAPRGMHRPAGVPVLSPAEYAAYAPEIRRRLEHSSDTNLLLNTATPMLTWGKFSRAPAPADSDLFAFGKSLVQRALEIDPQSTWAHQLLTLAADQEVLARLPESVWHGSLESRRAVIQSLPEGDRFRELAILAITAGDLAVRADRIQHDDAAAKAAWRQAAGYAREALAIAGAARSHTDYGTAFFQANMVLGMDAVVSGDAQAAVQYMMKAAEAPVTDALKYPIPNARPWTMNWQFPATLAGALVKAGEREAVIRFLERYSQMTVSHRERWVNDIALLKEGKLPSWAGS